MTDSKYQMSIYEALSNTNENLVIEAVAGSGKSTTLERGCAYLNPLSNAAMFAFNRDIVTALQERMMAQPKKPLRLNIQTMNAFGWGVCRQNQKGVVLNPYKTDDLLRTQYNLEDKQDRNKYFKFRGPIDRLIRLLKANLHTEPDVAESKIQELADYYGVDLPNDREFMQVARMMWASSMSQRAIMDFSDQVYQPLKMGWQIPQFDIGMVDELQDLNPGQQTLMMRAVRRFVGVGDRYQAIYAFAGADAKSLQNMIDKTESKVLPLSVCYRCPKAVVRMAQKLVPHIEYCDWAPEGIVDTLKLESFRKKAEPNDFVLCRVTSDLVSECLAMIRDGRKAMVKGKEIGEQIIGLIDRTGVSDFDKSETLYTEVVRYQAEQVERLERANREQAIEDLNDRVETVKVLLEGAPIVQSVKSRIRSIFSDKVEGIIFSTIHKAKGLQSKRVFLLRPDLLPHKKATTPEAIQQEKNLEYVADTRPVFTKDSPGEFYFVPKN